METAHIIRRLAAERERIIGLMADDILVVVSLKDNPARLAEYDALMAQPRRDLQQRIKAIDEELALYGPTIRTIQ